MYKEELGIDNRIRQRNHGFQPKHRFGFPTINKWN